MPAESLYLAATFSSIYDSATYSITMGILGITELILCCGSETRFYNSIMVCDFVVNLEQRNNMVFESINSSDDILVTSIYYCWFLFSCKRRNMGSVISDVFTFSQLLFFCTWFVDHILWFTLFYLINNRISQNGWI